MNGYEKSVDRNITGTDAEIVAILKTLTGGDIHVDSVRAWMREQKIWYCGADGLMKGSLATAYATASLKDQGSLDYLHATVWGDSATVLRTTDPFWAPQIAQLVGLVTALVPSVAVLVDEFYDLDGGRPYLSLTAVDFAAQRTEAADAEAERVAAEALETARMELRQTWQDVYNQNISPVLDGTEPTVANLLAGARLLVTDLEAL